MLILKRKSQVEVQEGIKFGEICFLVTWIKKSEICYFRTLLNQCFYTHFFIDYNFCDYKLVIKVIINIIL